jgi:hypothetical protein
VHSNLSDSGYVSYDGGSYRGNYCSWTSGAGKFGKTDAGMILIFMLLVLSESKDFASGILQKQIRLVKLKTGIFQKITCISMHLMTFLQKVYYTLTIPCLMKECKACLKIHIFCGQTSKTLLSR